MNIKLDLKCNQITANTKELNLVASFLLILSL